MPIYPDLDCRYGEESTSIRKVEPWSHTKTPGMACPMFIKTILKWRYTRCIDNIIRQLIQSSGDSYCEWALSAVQIEVSRFLRVLMMLKLLIFFTLSSTGLRGHELKLYKPQAHLDISKNFLQSYWWVESLAWDSIDCNTLSTFTKRLLF